MDAAIGIALHESPQVPDYPASHGCVRIPDGFAEELCAMTGLCRGLGLQSNVVAKPPLRVTARKKTVKKAKPEPALVVRRPLFPLVLWLER